MRLRRILISKVEWNERILSGNRGLAVVVYPVVELSPIEMENGNTSPHRPTCCFLL